MKYGLLLSLLIPISSYALDRSWDEITVPSKGASSSIGSYANGCLAGGEELSLDGTGYQVIRAQRNRYYGHQDMIRYLTDLASKVDRLGMGQLLVGDIAMPRGGRFTSGHASHQTGWTPISGYDYLMSHFQSKNCKTQNPIRWSTSTSIVSKRTNGPVIIHY